MSAQVSSPVKMIDRRTLRKALRKRKVSIRQGLDQGRFIPEYWTKKIFGEGATLVADYLDTGTIAQLPSAASDREE